MVHRAQEYIRAGDIFQIVLAQRFETDFTGDALDLYRSLRFVNPSPYMFCLRCPGGYSLVGSSPEVHVRLTGDLVEIRPIAGTRRRGATVEEDNANADDLMADTSREARALWTELRLELNIGQFLDIVGSARRERRRAEAEQICRYKSGKYTIERPLQLGALVTSAPLPAGVFEQLSAIGLPLGDAFQMRDDILGVFGESALTGKPAGDDLREGKPTPLLALTTELASPAELVVLNKVGRPDITATDIANIQEVIQHTGALQTMEDRITQLTAESVNQLSGLSLGKEAIEQFKALAHLVSWRSL
jgi:geranylgeranyl pyrophosphate synthase